MIHPVRNSPEGQISARVVLFASASTEIVNPSRDTANDIVHNFEDLCIGSSNHLTAALDFQQRSTSPDIEMSHSIFNTPVDSGEHLTTSVIEVFGRRTLIRKSVAGHYIKPA